MAPADEPTASAGVFAIPELLENILIFADTRQLFVIQAVNSIFRDTMKSSKEIRQKMCLEPTSDRQNLQGLLVNVAASGDTAPFKISFESRHQARDQLFRITLPCKFVHSELYCDGRATSARLKTSLETGSWRLISIADPNYASMMVHHECRNSLSWWASKKITQGDTLGDLIDTIIAAI